MARRARRTDPTPGGRPGQQPHPQRQLIQRCAARGKHQARPRRRARRPRQPRPPDPRQHPRPQQRRLARPRNTRHHQQPRARHQPRHPLKQLGGHLLPAEEERRVLFLERAQSAVRRIDHPRHADQRRRRHAIGQRQPVIGVVNLDVAVTDLHAHAAPGINRIPATRLGRHVNRPASVVGTRIHRRSPPSAVRRAPRAILI